MQITDELITLFQTRGHAAYFGEAVSQQEHALQAAALAENEGASDALIAAALLHDVGHLIHGQDEDIAARGLDGRHEEAGHAWLARHFGPAVTEPIKLHVAAKRYLCAVDRDYESRLSPASRRSLELQGGPMRAEETQQLERHKFYREAVRLRCWDDEAKTPGLAVPGLEHYRALLEALAEQRATSP
jgi:phosphonate degradation associated HDIG domain protein